MLKFWSISWLEITAKCAKFWLTNPKFDKISLCGSGFLLTSDAGEVIAVFSWERILEVVLNFDLFEMFVYYREVDITRVNQVNFKMLNKFKIKKFNT